MDETRRINIVSSAADLRNAQEVVLKAADTLVNNLPASRVWTDDEAALALAVIVYRRELEARR